MAGVILLVFIITSFLATCYSLRTNNCVCDDSCEQRGLTEIPQCLPQSVKEILVSHNSISQLSEGSFKMYASLETVDVSYNNLSTLQSGTFQNTPTLTRLILRRNVISSMAVGLLKPLTKLELFSVSENSIEEISETTFEQNVNIKSLFLYRNRLSHIGKHLFRYLRKLQRLNLSNNLISSLHMDTFSGNPSLKELFIAFNRIDHLDAKLFEGNTKLEYLDLSGNDLMSLEAGIFKQNPQLMTLVMSDNPWHCDCHMRTTVLELRNRKVELDNIGKCWNPLDISGDLSTLITVNVSCQMNGTNQEVSSQQNSGKSQLCDDTDTNFIMVLVGGCIIILAQITICSLFAFYRYVVLKKTDERKANFMKRKSTKWVNHYMRPSYEIPINISNKTVGNQNEYSYIVPTSNESMYACISENDNKYISIIDSDKVSPPQQQAEDVYTVMRPQNLNLDHKYLTMKGKIINYDNVR